MTESNSKSISVDDVTALLLQQGGNSPIADTNAKHKRPDRPYVIIWSRCDRCKKREQGLWGTKWPDSGKHEYLCSSCSNDAMEPVEVSPNNQLEMEF